MAVIAALCWFMTGYAACDTVYPRLERRLWVATFALHGVASTGMAIWIGVQ